MVNLRGFIAADLLRWGLTATAILVAGFLAGRCSAYTGPVSRLAELGIDSARIHDAAFDRGNREATLRFQFVKDSLQRDIDSSSARLARAGVATSSAGTGTRQALADARASIANLTADTAEIRRAALKAIQAVEDSLTRYDSTVARERLAAQTHADNALRLIQADSVEIARLNGVVADVQGQRDGGVKREERLARQLRAWRLGVTVGPGASFDGRFRGAPIQVTVGASKVIQIPCLLPWGCGAR